MKMPMDRSSTTDRSMVRTVLRKGLPRLRIRESEVDRELRENEQRTSLKDEQGRTLYPQSMKDLET